MISLESVKLVRQLSCCVVVCALLWSGVQAETNTGSHPVMDDRFTLYIGGFFPQVSSDIRLDADIGAGSGGDISFEDTLGLEDSDTVFWGGLIWKIGGRHRLEFEYFQLNRSGAVGAVTDPFEIGDHSVQVGANVETVFDVGVGRVTYGYAFIQDEKKHLNAKAGLHWADVDIGIRLSGAVIDTTTDMTIIAGTTVTEAGDVSAPLPHLGLSFTYSISPKLLVRAQILGFALSVGDYSGRLFDVAADIAYSPWRHVGIGVGLRYFDLELDADTASLNGEFEFDYWGPTVFGLFSF